MDIGICHLACYPLRRDNSHRSEMVSQVLFGESFIILDRLKDWYRVRLDFDRYEGWVEAPEMVFLSGKVHKQLQNEKQYFLKSVFAHINREAVLCLSLGSRLPFWDGKYCTIGNEKIEINTGDVFYKTGDFDIKPAMELIGTPYLWGGKSSYGIDCSGLVQTIYKLNGIGLPRDASQQVESGVEVPFEERKPFDLAFFENENGNITHVGIILNDERILHASVRVRIDLLTERGIRVEEKKKLSHQLSRIKRVLE